MTDTSVQNAAEAMAQDPGTGFQRVESRLPKASDPHERLAQGCHDLQVHQTELEQQNQELRQLQAVLEASRERYATSMISHPSAISFWIVPPGSRPST